MNPRRAPTVLVFHTSFRSSWNEMQDGLHRYAYARKWNVFVAEHELDRKTIEDLLAFWRPDGVIVEGAMDEKGVFLSDVFGATPVVYLVCDPARRMPGALCVNHDSMSLGRVAAREFLSLVRSQTTHSGSLRRRTSCGASPRGGCRVPTPPSRRRWRSSGFAPATD